MTDTKVSALSAASALAGTEVVPGVQSAASVKITITQIGTRVQAQLAAVQADMETGTSTVLFVTPGVQKNHPGHPKCWGRFDTAGGRTANYGIASLVDTGTGDVAVTFTTSFSGATVYACHVSVEMTATTFAVANARKGVIKNATLAAASVSLQCIDDTATTELIKDPSSWHFVGYGDFA
jgi:hypothetical protein